MTSLLELHDPDRIWADLTARHRAVAARTAHDGTPVHAPVAAVLACSDARVPPSVLFDAEPGSLFIVRQAGNTASPSAVASLDYAVEHLGVRLVVVLGHTGCGAVAAALDGAHLPDLAAVVDPITSLLDGCDRCDTIDETVAANVDHTVAALRDDPGGLGAAVRRGEVVLRGAVHDLATGELHERPGPSAVTAANGTNPSQNQESTP